MSNEGTNPGQVNDSKLQALVRAAIELAVVRHDLDTEDGCIADADGMKAVVDDVWEALQGIGTCEAGPDPAFAAVVADREQSAATIAGLTAAIKEIGDNCGCTEFGVNPCANCLRGEAAIAQAEGGGRCARCHKPLPVSGECAECRLNDGLAAATE